MCNFNWGLDDLTINPYTSPEGRRALSRQETFVLAWFIYNKEGRTYRQINERLQVEQPRTKPGGCPGTYRFRLALLAIARILSEVAISRTPSPVFFMNRNYSKSALMIRSDSEPETR